MSNTKVIFSFILGAAAGAVVAWKVLERKFEEKLLEEVTAEKEAYEQRLGALNSAYSNKPSDREIAADLARELNYTGEEESNVNGPRVIHPDEYAQIEEYDIQSLIYYVGDGVLTDDYNHPIENIEDTVGLGFEEHFDEYEEEKDSVFIQNDNYKTYYEINRCLDKFSEIAEVYE